MNRKEVQHIKLKNLKKTTPISFPQEGFVAGISPYLRGAYATMYINKPWEIKQYTGLSTVKESNTLYRKNLDTGLKKLFVDLDLSTCTCNHSDTQRAPNDVDITSITIQSVEDMNMLFDQIPLDNVAVSITINSTILPLLAFYIVTAEEQGISLDQLSGSLKSDILKELNTYTPTLSSKIFTDIFEYTSKKMPEFNSISISGYKIQEAGATAEIELAYTLSNGLEFLKKGIEAGIKIDSLATQLSFCWATGMDHFTEIAKLRAARVLWAKMVKQFNPKNPESLALKTHSQTSCNSLTTQDPFNNVTRVTLQAMAAAFGGTQSLHINTLDEGTAVSARIARNTQTYLQQETHITKTVDPWAGSYHLEKLTEDIANKTWELISELEHHGGISKAIKKGIPKLHIENAAAIKQVKIANGEQVVVGVNKYQLKKEKTSTPLEIDNKTTSNIQLEKLHQLKTTRNNTEVQKSLIALTNAVKHEKENLLEATIKAARNRATLSEISDALQTVFK